MKTKTVLALIVLLLGTTAWGQRLSPLESEPDWSRLDRFQETISRREFERLLSRIYAPRGAWKICIEIGDDSATIRRTMEPEPTYVLRFAREPAKAVPKYWRPMAELGPAADGSPLAGLKIAIDSGHIGGNWARMEERWFRIGDSVPVTEGDMTLRVANELVPRLQALGAEVTLVRPTAAPVTHDTPSDLRETAIAELKRRGIESPRETYTDPKDPARGSTVQWHSEILFYRASEIRARARIVNEKIQPDLVIALHFNAEVWGNPDAPELVDKNHLHLLVNGCYDAGELTYDDIRFGMLEKLLSRTSAEAIAMSDSVALAMAKATGLPPYTYTGTNAIAVGSSGYVWARNLLANRLYLCPVLYLEPYVMNSQAVFDRVQLGDYVGEREIQGQLRRSIYQEYSDSVVAGLVHYAREVRGK